MSNTLKGWIAPNTVTTDPNDKILLLETTGKADTDRIIEEMQAEDTGLRRETLVHSITLYERVCARLLMNGWQLNTGLFYAVPRFTNLIEKGRWNPEKNNIYVVFTQNKVIREEIAKTNVSILGEKSGVMYILETEDRKTGLSDGRITPGRNFVVRGASLKITGTNENVGVTLTDSNGVVTKFEDDLININMPSELNLLAPTGLADGDYVLTVTTQFAGGGSTLKEPRSVSVNVYVGEKSGGGDDDDRPVIE